LNFDGGDGSLRSCC